MTQPRLPDAACVVSTRTRLAMLSSRAPYSVESSGALPVCDRDARTACNGETSAMREVRGSGCAERTTDQPVEQRHTHIHRQT